MEEANETALAELVEGTLLITDFNYGNMSQERIIELESRAQVGIEMGKKALAYWGETLIIAKQYFEDEFGYDCKEFLSWADNVHHLKQSSVYRYMRAFRVSQNVKELPQAAKINVEKLASLDKLSPELQKEVIEKFPLDRMNKKEVAELSKKIKEIGEVNEQLIEDVNQRNQEIKNLQQTEYQKDQEIQQLKAKIQELETQKIQSNSQTEPEVVEKIIEVEKVVEKEVVPEKLKAELESYKKLAQDNKNNIPDYILDELDTLRKTVNEKNEQLEDAKRTVEAIATQQNSKFGTQNIDWGLLGNVINNFLSKASEYTYMKEAFSVEDGKSKNFVKTQVDRIEKWVIEMKRMMNVDLCIGNTIYVEDTNVEVMEGEDV